MYNLLIYSKNYRKTTGSLWNYYRDEPSDPLSSNSEENIKYKAIDNKIVEINADNGEKYIRELLDSSYQGLSQKIICSCL